jgi:hypothetical protein
MPSSRIRILAFVFLALTGCGTFHNLKDAPNGTLFMGTGCCYPFGGVGRSALLAGLGTPMGLGMVINGDIAITEGDFGPGFQQVGEGLLLTSAGLLAIADTPLSLAGDLLTFPIAYARSKEYPWATWWGEPFTRDPGTPLAPASDGSDKKIEGGIQPSH